MAILLEVQWSSGIHVLLRGLSWKDHKRLFLQASEEPIAAYCTVYEITCVEGPPLSLIPAGCVAFIGKLYLELSPFSGSLRSIQVAQNQSRKSNESFLNQAQAIIAGSLHYTLEEIENWDADTFFDRLAKAELLLGRPLAAHSAEQNPKDPNTPKADQYSQALQERKEQNAAVRKQTHERILARRQRNQ